LPHREENISDNHMTHMSYVDSSFVIVITYLISIREQCDYLILCSPAHEPQERESVTWSTSKSSVLSSVV